MYHEASVIVTAGNPYEKAIKKLKALFTVADPEKQAQIRFYAVNPDDKYKKTLVLLKKMWKATVLCNFAHPDQKIMQVLFNKCADAKFQEKATLADWNKTNLAQAELFA